MRRMTNSILSIPHLPSVSNKEIAAWIYKASPVFAGVIGTWPWLRSETHLLPRGLEH